MKNKILNIVSKRKKQYNRKLFEFIPDLKEYFLSSFNWYRLFNIKKEYINDKNKKVIQEVEVRAEMYPYSSFEELLKTDKIDYLPLYSYPLTNMDFSFSNGIPFYFSYNNIDNEYYKGVTSLFPYYISDNRKSFEFTIPSYFKTELGFITLNTIIYPIRIGFSTKEEIEEKFINYDYQFNLFYKTTYTEKEGLGITYIENKIDYSIGIIKQQIENTYTFAFDWNNKTDENGNILQECNCNDVIFLFNFYLTKEKLNNNIEYYAIDNLYIKDII